MLWREKAALRETVIDLKMPLIGQAVLRRTQRALGRSKNLVAGKVFETLAGPTGPSNLEQLDSLVRSQPEVDSSVAGGQIASGRRHQAVLLLSGFRDEAQLSSDAVAVADGPYCLHDEPVVIVTAVL